MYKRVLIAYNNKLGAEKVKTYITKKENEFHKIVIQMMQKEKKKYNTLWKNYITQL